ncbi:MAG: phosphoenolpyruvate--protein phosphotransferase [Ignavibacterium album]|uniref:phosphoenolpyruvate--protein phosphotransferase n=1 Tax=Ignavibacterium album TaxID=591197 RepID=UPI0026EE9CCC|nr:phosphoenolpyruvate--protein phosphotransferase [Ignavibacterium album]MCX8104363.1 phosphoenolpyruvate--protein phosphotransferase [Ignavibacterium album]
MKSFKEIISKSHNKIPGIAAAPGIVIGKAYLFTKEKIEISTAPITDVEEAIKNFYEALAQSKKELQKIFQIAKEKMDETRAAIFEAHLMILDDPVLLNTIIERIKKEKVQPEFIVADEISKYQELMIISNESYMKERAQDIEDIKNRIIRNLQKKRLHSKIESEVIVVSETLTPADTLLFSKHNSLGFVTDHGGLTSHAAIISRSLNIPAVVGTHNATQIIKDGSVIIVDGFHGYVFYEPTEDQIKFYSEKQKRLFEIQKGLEEYKDKEAITSDGKKISVEANVDVSGEIDIVISSGANGIGLYRSEQILDELGEFPNEEEQTTIYSKLASRMYPLFCTIRAFDIGGDKFRFQEYKEPNPFLGLRGIRFLLENEALFRTQIRAILKASKHKNIRFMLPMISTIDEIWQSKKIIEECKKELRKEKIEFDNKMKIGIMIEVPSAAVMAKDLASEVDFFSIGTNDLIQYLMAVDRGNDLVADLYQEFSPVVVRTIHHVVQGAKEFNTPVSLCGEMAADTLAIPLLVGLGLDSLSMSPATILYAKRIINSFSYKKAKAMAEECLTFKTQHEIEERIKKFFEENKIIRTRNII